MGIIISYLSSFYTWLTERLSWKTKKDGLSQGDEIITSLIGSIGSFQICLYFLAVLVKFPLAFQMFAIIFLAPKSTTFVGDSGVKGECPATNPKYDAPIFSTNAITEYNLICERRWMQGFSQLTFQFGNLVGSFTFGAISDRYGRKWPFVIACAGEFLMGIAGAFMPEYWSYAISRFFVGVFCAGTLVLCYVVTVEFMGAKHRSAFAPLVQFPFCLGHMLIPLVAYFHDNFKSYQIFNGASAFMFILYIFFLPETPRWLLAMKKTEKCIKIVEKVAKWNKLPTSDVRSRITEFHERLYVDKQKEKRGNCFDLLKSPSMRKHLLICAITWLSLGFSFYGLAQFVGSFGGNVYINVEVSAIVNAAGGILGLPLLQYFGRKVVSFGTFLICGACVLVMTVVYNDIVRVVLASIGIFCAITAWAAAYLFVTDLFPTVVRSAAFGICSTLARVGSMIAPLVIDLGDDHIWLPPLVFGIPSLVSAFLILLLPETKGHLMLTTLAEERERYSKRPVTVNAAK